MKPLLLQETGGVTAPGEPAPPPPDRKLATPISSPQLQAARRQREDRAVLFACPNCDRTRVDVWAIAHEPDTFVVCAHGTLGGCGLCGDAYIDDSTVAVPAPDLVTSPMPLAAE